MNPSDFVINEFNKCSRVLPGLFVCSDRYVDLRECTTADFVSQFGELTGDHACLHPVLFVSSSYPEDVLSERG